MLVPYDQIGKKWAYHLPKKIQDSRKNRGVFSRFLKFIKHNISGVFNRFFGVCNFLVSEILAVGTPKTLWLLFFMFRFTDPSTLFCLKKNQTLWKCFLVFTHFLQKILCERECIFRDINTDFFFFIKLQMYLFFYLFQVLNWYKQLERQD